MIIAVVKVVIRFCTGRGEGADGKRSSCVGMMHLPGKVRDLEEEGVPC